ncbi:MAG: autotransporter outer membrane beta-barrel domain-containing protein [Puniceicoccales bacterium]|jgi:hypothetical protein|nr:autotransporter outer membrane beta-barrel domain-containing protein [Puniceicoccales bacterium]
MKEKNRKMGPLANRYGLLTVLGLGCSFLVGAAHGTETAVTENTRYVAGKNAGNVFKFGTDGALPAAATDASIFTNGNEDRLTLKGAANAGALAQVIFDTAGETAVGGTFQPEVKNADLAAVKTSLLDNGDLNEIFAHNGAPADHALATLLNRIAVIQAVNVLDAAFAALPADVNPVANQLNGVVGATNANGGGVTNTEFKAAIALIKTNASAFGDVTALTNKLTAIDGAGGTALFGTTPLNGTQAKAEAIAKDINAILAATNANHGLKEEFDAITNAATTQATAATTFAGNLNTGMTTGAGEWNTANSGKGELIDGGVNAATTAVVSGNLGAAGIFEAIQTQHDQFITWLNIPANVAEADLIAAVQAVFAPGGGAPADRATALAVVTSNLNTALNAAKTAAYGALKGLFDVAPAPAAGAAATPRTFTYQISQSDLKNDLNLTSSTTSKNFAVIDPATMNANETVMFIFDTTTREAKSVNVGNIFYKKLDKDLNLHLVHTLMDQNGTIETVGFNEIKDPFDPNATLNHLTLQLSTAAQERSGNNPDFIFDKEIFVKKLILGIPNTQEIDIAIKSDVQDKLINNYKIGPGGVDVKFEENLTVANDIEVLQNSELKFVDTKTLYLGGNLKLRDGSATLHLGTGSARETVNIAPLAAQAGNIVFENRDVLMLTSNVTLNVTNPGRGTDYYFKGITGAPNAAFTVAAPDDHAITLKLDAIDAGAMHVNGVAVGGANDIAMITVGDGGTLELENITIKTTDDEKNPIIAKFGSNGTLELDNVTLGGTGIDITALKAGENFTIGLNGATNLYGNINAGKGATLAVDLGNPGTLKWPEGSLALPANEKLKIEIGDSSDAILEKGLSALKTAVANSKLNIIDLSGNAANAAAIGALVSLDLVSSPLLKGAALKFDATTGLFTLEVPANAVPSNLAEYLANSGSFDRAYISDDLFSIVDKAVQSGAKTNIEALLVQGIFNPNYSNAQKSKILSALSKTTTEEKNRATLTLIDTARETIYGKMGQDPDPGKHYSVWVSGFGDVARNGSSGSYKMKCNTYGFTLGVDTHINDDFLLGAVFGYGKAKAKNRGDMALSSDGRFDLKSYFGGIYGMWDELVPDLSLKFSVLAGHGKYEEKQYFDFGIAKGTILDSSHDGNWLSGNVDFTYKHWSVMGFNVGPWVSLSATTIHQKSGDVGSATTTKTDRMVNSTATHYKREVAAADRRAIEAIFGVAMDYEFAAGIFELALGYKHDWRKLKGGKVSIWEAFSDGNYKGLTAASGSNHISEFFKFGASNMETGKHAFVGRAAWNMQFGNFGLTLGGHGQAGSHFKDISGFITASYSF